MNTSYLDFPKVTEIMTTTNLTTDDSFVTEQSESGYSPLRTIQTIVLPLIYSIVCIVGLIGNGLVIYIMHVKNRNRNITDLYVLNLAIADFIFVAMLPFWTTDTALQRWVFGHLMCKLTSGFTYFHMYASVFFLTAMSVDRFVAVVLYQSCRRTKRGARIAVISMWMTATVLGLLPLFFRGVSGSEPPKCQWMFNHENLSHYVWFVIYFITRSIIGFVIPFIIIAVSYSLIICFLKRRTTRGRVTNKRQDRATKLVLVVIAVFILCWLPNQISNFIYVVEALNVRHPDQKEPSILFITIHYYLHMFSTCLTWMHSCVNPILYAFMRQDLRTKFTEVLNYNVKRCCGDKTRNNKQSRKNRQIFSSLSLSRHRPSNRQSFTESLRLSTIREKSCCDDENKARMSTEREGTSLKKCRPEVCNSLDEIPEMTTSTTGELKRHCVIVNDEEIELNTDDTRLL